MDAGRIEPPPTDGDLSPSEVGGDRAAVHSEEGRQLHERRALAVLRHQIVDLLGTQQGLSHPK